MEKEQTIKSVLRLDKIMFDKIEFRRVGTSSDKELELEIQSGIARRQDAEIYRVTLVLKGNKPEEYLFEISLSGFFSIEESDELTES